MEDLQKKFPFVADVLVCSGIACYLWLLDKDPDEIHIYGMDLSGDVYLNDIPVEYWKKPLTLDEYWARERVFMDTLISGAESMGTKTIEH